MFTRAWLTMLVVCCCFGIGQVFANTPPEAIKGCYAFDEDQSRSITLAGTDGKETPSAKLTFALEGTADAGGWVSTTHGKVRFKPVKNQPPSVKIVEYIPNTNFSGFLPKRKCPTGNLASFDDSFSFVARDADGAVSTPAIIGLIVNPVADAPIAQDQVLSTFRDTPIDVTLLADDPDADSYPIRANLSS